MTMTIDELATLKEKKEAAYSAWKIQLKSLTDKLYNLLMMYNNGPAKILLPREKELVQLDSSDWPHRDTFEWKVSKEIYFENQDLKDPKRDYDFGSSFSLYICNDGIKVNHGSCGEWGKDDKGQLSRMMLIIEIFNHEQEIIDSLNPLCDFTIRKQFDEIDYAIEQIERDLREAERERERKQIISSIHHGQYLAKIGYHWVYPEEDKLPAKKVLHYYDHEKVINITEKSVITDIGRCATHRYKIEDVVFKIKHKSLFVVNSTDDTPPEESGSSN